MSGEEVVQYFIVPALHTLSQDDQSTLTALVSSGVLQIYKKGAFRVSKRD